MASSETRPKIVRLMVLGLGGAGRNLLHEVLEGTTRHAKYGLEIRVVGVWDDKSLTAITSLWSSGLPESILRGLSTDPTTTEGTINHKPTPPSSPASDRTESGRFLTTLSLFKRPTTANVAVYVGQEILKKALYICNQLGSALVIADCSQDEASCSLVNAFLQSGCFLLLANQLPLVTDRSVFNTLMQNRWRVNVEPAIGGRLPVVDPLRMLLCGNGKRIASIVGSGSEFLSFVMSQVEGGTTFSKAVLNAQTSGLILQDPRPNLNGMDIARKALILARIIGYETDLKDVKVEALLEDQFMQQKISTTAALEKVLCQEDDRLSKKANATAAKERSLRYGFCIEHDRVTVGFLELAKDSPLVRLNNSLEIHVDDYEGSPLVIPGVSLDDKTKAEAVLGEIWRHRDRLS